MHVMHGWLRRVKIRKPPSLNRFRLIGSRTDRFWFVEPCLILFINHDITLQSAKRKPLQR